MITAISILMIGLLFWVTYEDVKDRKVTLLLLIVLFLTGGFLNSQQLSTELFLISSIINLSVIAMVVFVLFLYVQLKLQTKLFNVFGSGDLLFFAFMAISFPTISFLVLFSISLIFSLLISLAFQKQLKKLVPLAGLQALFLALFLGSNTLFHLVDLYAF